MTVTPWDDYPVHQSSNWIANVATSDRNFYDRYYFNVLDTQGRFMIGMGLQSAACTVQGNKIG